MKRLNAVRCGAVRLGAARCGSARLGVARLGPARCDRLGSARHGTGALRCGRAPAPARSSCTAAARERSRRWPPLCAWPSRSKKASKKYFATNADRLRREGTSALRERATEGHAAQSVQCLCAAGAVRSGKDPARRRAAYRSAAMRCAAPEDVEVDVGRTLRRCQTCDASRARQCHGRAGE